MSLIHSRKIIGLLFGHSFNGIIFRTTQSHLLLRKDKMRLNTRLEISSGLSLWGKPACQTLSKALDISSNTVSVASEPLKVLNSSIKYNCQKIWSWTRRFESLLEIRKKDNQQATSPLFLSFSKTLLIYVYK